MPYFAKSRGKAIREVHAILFTDVGFVQMFIVGEVMREVPAGEVNVEIVSSMNTYILVLYKCLH